MDGHRTPEERALLGRSMWIAVDLPGDLKNSEAQFLHDIDATRGRHWADEQGFNSEPVLLDGHPSPRLLSLPCEMKLWTGEVQRWPGMGSRESVEEAPNGIGSVCDENQAGGRPSPPCSCSVPGSLEAVLFVSGGGHDR